MRQANSSDIELLLDLMTEFYGEGAYALNRTVAAQAFGAILDDARLGYVWIIQA